MIALLHQLEEDIGLLRLEVRVTHFIDQKDVQTRQTIHQPARRAIGQRSVHFIEQILRANELATQPERGTRLVPFSPAWRSSSGIVTLPV